MWLFCLSMAMPCMWPDLNGPEWMFLGRGCCAAAPRMFRLKAISIDMIKKRFIVSEVLVVKFLCEDTIFFQNGKTFIYLLIGR